MPNQSSYQIVIHYINGQVEAFNVNEPTDVVMVEQEVQQEVRRFLDKDWWLFHLADATMCINRANVLKIELKPAIPQIHNDGIFSNVQQAAIVERV